MGKFSRVKKHRKLSSTLSIDEKIESLNKEMKKTGMLSEKMTTSDMYTKTSFTPYVPATWDEVPDSSGVTGDGWTQPGDETDTDTWDVDDFDNTTLYTDMSYLKNPNNLNGETDRAILDGIGSELLSAAGRDPGFGIALNGNYYGLAIGYVGGGRYHGVLSGGLIGGTNQPTEESRGYGGSYRGVSDEEFAVKTALWNLWYSKYYNDYYSSPSTLETKTIAVWVPYNRHHHYQRGGEYADWPYPKSDGYILENVALVMGRNTYQNQDTEHAKTTVLQRIGIGDPTYYPGDVGNFLMKLLNLGKEGWQYLSDKAKSAGDALELEKIYDTVKGIYNFSSAQLDNLLNNTAALADAAPPFIDFLRHQISDTGYTDNNPRETFLSKTDSQQASNGIQEIVSNWPPGRLQELGNGAPMTNEELLELNVHMNNYGGDPTAPTPTNTTPQKGGDTDSYRLVVNNIGNPYAFKGNVELDLDGTPYVTGIKDTYIFTGDDDASAPGAPALIKFFSQLPGVQNAIKNSKDGNIIGEYTKDIQIRDMSSSVTKDDGGTINVKNMPINVVLPPPSDANVGFDPANVYGLDTRDVAKEVKKLHQKNKSKQKANDNTTQQQSTNPTQQQSTNPIQKQPNNTSSWKPETDVKTAYWTGDGSSTQLSNTMGGGIKVQGEIGIGGNKQKSFGVNYGDSEIYKWQNKHKKPGEIPSETDQETKTKTNLDKELKKFDINKKDQASSSKKSNIDGIKLAGGSGSNRRKIYNKDGDIESITTDSDFGKKLFKAIYGSKIQAKKKVNSKIQVAHYEPQGELIKEDISDVSLAWASPKHTNIERNERERWFNTKDIQPLVPKKPTPKMVDGYHADSKLAPQKVNEDPFIKITEKDILRNHKLSDYEKKEWTDTINAINEFLAAHPEELIHARQRYPKNDPKLAELNWKLDQMLSASEEYIDSHFPENTRLFNKLQKATKKTIQITDPEYIGKHYAEVRGTLRTVNDFNQFGSDTKKKQNDKLRKKNPARFFKKPKSKSKSSVLKHLNPSDIMKKNLKVEEQLRIEQEIEQEVIEYTSSTMEKVKYDWRSKDNSKDILREKMTTSAVMSTTLSADDEDNPGEEITIDTTLEASFTDGPVNGLDNIMFRATAIKDSGTGSGSNGGFNIGKHLAFSSNTNSDGSHYQSTASRHALLAPIDARIIDTITITAIRGNDSNGGELPDAANEDLRLMWFRADPDGYNGVGSWMTIDFENSSPLIQHNDVSPTIIPRVSGDAGGYDGSFPGLRDWTITIPDYCKNENQRFALYQMKHSGHQYDHYGITAIKYRARTPSTVFVPLDSPEASSFVRIGTNVGDPKKRKKKLEDQLKASKEYTDTILGTDFPGGSATLSEPESSPIGYDQLSKTHINASILSQQLKKALAPDTQDAPKDSKALSAIKAAATDKVKSDEGEKGKYGEQEYIKNKKDYDTATKEVDKLKEDLKDVKGLSDAKYKNIRMFRDLPTNKVINSVAEVLRKVTGGFSLPVDLTLKYALGDMTAVTKSPGKAYDKATLDVLRVAHNRSGDGEVSAKDGDYSGTGNYEKTNLLTFQTASVQGAKNNFRYQVTDKGIRILDTFNFTDPKNPASTTIGAFKSIKGAQWLATKLVEIGDWKARYSGNDPRDESYGVPIDYTIPLSSLSQSDKDIFYGKPGSDQRKWVDSYNNTAQSMNKTIVPFQNRMNEILKEKGALVGQKTWEYKNLLKKSNEVNKFVTDYTALSMRKDYKGINSHFSNENIPLSVKKELGGQIPTYDDNGEVTTQPLKNKYGVEYDPRYEMSDETIDRLKRQRMSSNSLMRGQEQAPYSYKLGGNSITGVAGEGMKTFKIWGHDTNLYEARAYTYWDGVGWTPSHVGSNHWQGHAGDGYFSRAMRYLYDPELKADPEKREKYLNSRYMKSILNGRTIEEQITYYRNFGKTSHKFSKTEPDGKGGTRTVPGYYRPGETYYQSSLAYWKQKIEEAGGTFVDAFDQQEGDVTDTTSIKDTEEKPIKPDDEETLPKPDEELPTDKKDDTNKVTPEDEKWLGTQQTLVNLTKGLTNIGLPNDFGQWSINYAKGDMTPINKFSRGMEKEVEKLVLKKFKENPNSKSVTISYNDYGGRFNAMSTRLGLGTFKATRLPNGKVQIDDTFNVDKTFKTVGAFDIIPGLQDTANRIVDIAHKRRNLNTYDEGGIPVKVILDMGSQLKKIGYSIDEPIVRTTTPKKKKKVVKEDTAKRIIQWRKKFEYEGKPSPEGFPDTPPVELDPKTKMHPNYGKNASRYKKLDPASANAMPKTGDPETDAVVAKQKTKKKTRSNWREELESII